MEPPLKKQKIDPYYGDRLLDDDYNLSLSTFIPNKLCSDLAKVILQTFELDDFVRLTLVCKNWNSIANHHLAPLRAEIFKSVINPEDWNHASPTYFGIPIDERKQAFRSLPLKLDMNSYCVAWGSTRSMTINSFHEFLNEYYKKNPFSGFISIDENISKIYGDCSLAKSQWIAIKRSKHFKYRTFGEEQELEDFNRITSKVHTVPKLLDAVICIIGELIKFEKPLINGFTHCQESADNLKILVGGDRSVAIQIAIDSNLIPAYHKGIAVQLKL